MHNPYDAYKSNTVFTATKEELTLMLYDGALKFCNQALLALEKKDMEKTNEMIMKVQAIIQEFQLTLDKKFEISTQLNSLYDYIYNQLIQANVKKDAGILADTKEMIRSLRDTWKEAMKLNRKGQPHATVSSNQ